MSFILYLSIIVFITINLSLLVRCDIILILALLSLVQVVFLLVVSHVVNTKLLADLVSSIFAVIIFLIFLLLFLFASAA